MYNFTACSEKEIYLNQTVIPGRLFNFSLISLDVIESVGYAERLYSSAYRRNITSKDHELLLNDG